MPPFGSADHPLVIDLTSDLDEEDEGLDDNFLNLDPLGRFDHEEENVDYFEDGESSSSNFEQGFEDAPDFVYPIQGEEQNHPLAGPNAFNDVPVAALDFDGTPLNFDRDWDAILAVPDVGVAPTSPQPRAELPFQTKTTSHSHAFTEDVCLAQVLELFPDIAHDHVRTLYQTTGNDDVDRRERTQNIIEKLLDGEADYPKERARREELKRKRRDSQDEANDENIYEHADAASQAYIKQAFDVLCTEFNDVPVVHIRAVLREEKTLFRSCARLRSQLRELENSTGRPFTKVNKARPKMNPSSRGLAGSENPIWKELLAARRKGDKEEQEVQEQNEKDQKEALNEQEARATNSMGECAVCFSDTPLNRMSICDGGVAHFFCFDCTRMYVETQVGDGKCKLVCMDTSGCTAPITNQELRKALRGDLRVLSKLERMQQEEDIRLAGLDDLEECPFCEYKAILPPIEVDKEFRCQGKDCGKVSCRRCQKDTHVPKSCEEVANDNAAQHLHRVQEAMTEALTRTCNKCKKRFIKESGCNKITCPTCNNRQCYCCGKNVTDYAHFNQNGPGTAPPGPNNKKCPLYDNTEARHAEDVENAEKIAVAQQLAENPELKADDLRAKVSERVREADRQRIAAAQPRVPGAPHAGPANLFGGVPGARRPMVGLPFLDFEDDEFGMMEAEPPPEVPLPRRRHHHVHHHHHHVVPNEAANPFQEYGRPRRVENPPIPPAAFPFGNIGDALRREFGNAHEIFNPGREHHGPEGGRLLGRMEDYQRHEEVIHRNLQQEVRILQQQAAARRGRLTAQQGRPAGQEERAAGQQGRAAVQQLQAAGQQIWTAEQDLRAIEGEQRRRAAERGLNLAQYLQQVRNL